MTDVHDTNYVRCDQMLKDEIKYITAILSPPRVLILLKEIHLRYKRLYRSFLPAWFLAIEKRKVKRREGERTLEILFVGF